MMVSPRLTEIPVRFYRSAAGADVVLDWLRVCRAKIGA
jgi:hypothetical protein